MKVTNAIAQVLKKEGVECADRLSGQPDHRGGGRGRYPHDHGAPGAHRAAYVRRDRQGQLGRQDRRLRDAARARHRERLRRRRAILRRFLPGGRVAGRLCPQHQPGAPELQRRAQFPPRHQMCRAGDGRRRDGRGAAPRLHARSRTAAPARCWSSSRPTSCARRFPTRWSPNTRRRRGSKSGPDPQSVSQIAEALVAAQRPVIVAGQGVHYGKAWPQLKALAELLEAPVMTTLPGKSAFPGEPSAVAGLGRHRHRRASVALPAERRFHLRHRLQLHPLQLLRRRCRRARRSPMRRSTRTRSTRTCRSIWRRSAMPG